MSEPKPSYHDNPTEPKLKLPSGSCDCHFHVFGPEQLNDVVDVAHERVSRAVVVAEEDSDPVEANDAACSRAGAHDVIRDVARMVVERLASGVAREHRSAARLDRVVEGPLARVREVDDHSELVHRADDAASEGGEPLGDARPRAFPDVEADIVALRVHREGKGLLAEGEEFHHLRTT